MWENTGWRFKRRKEKTLVIVIMVWERPRLNCGCMFLLSSFFVFVFGWKKEKKNHQWSFCYVYYHYTFLSFVWGIYQLFFYSDIHYWWKIPKINIFEFFCTNLSSQFLFWEKKSHIHILCLFVSLSFVFWRAAPQCRRQWLECLRDFNTRRSKITH